MNLMPLAALLEDNGFGMRGQKVFLDMMPAEAETAVLLRNPLHGTKINHELIGYFRADFDIIVRVPSAKYDDGETLIESVIVALTLVETIIENLNFKFCRPDTEPVVYPLSKGNLLEFSVRMDCCFSKVL